ncbi:stage II sporulation protein M [Sphingomonas kyeonggiensis]|uniref:Putative membrane protein SpoIIM required for sporulation n=1 Tax=Sphingomonas kyeonggiensis TaxID=1268553 RepID=A0A7W6JPW6_9SPHN|nr:putative membrane protein SpoIIM required for sporulation [Sphingomonas kyeonggiensis]
MSGAASSQFASARFREARTIDWLELDQRIREIERGRASGLSDEDLFELPVLYRAALSSLSVARETSLDADLVAYLEALCARAYFVLYGVQPPLRRRIASYFATGWPLALRSLARETVIAVLLMLLGAVATYCLVASDPSWYHSIVPADLAGGRGPQSSAAELRAGLYDGGGKDGMLGVFATYLFTHNAQISLMCFALGFAFGVPTILLLVYNGCILGAFMAVFVSKGLGLPLAAWLSIHGTTEMFAIAIAGAAGLRIGMAVAFPGRLSRTAATAKAGRTAAFAMIGVVLMLAVAGLLEGVGRQIVTSDLIRVAIGGGALLLWLLYFYVMPVRDEDAHG